ncbi:hypothetical protein [Burkholderia diffusa]|uniref:hypothetical protein n=1 Tax=Burkholderia diffusa TaxID=488732 RepID=UPI00158CEA0B|nr:hypothetical protein [Burkholderia diffusa]
MSQKIDRSLYVVNHSDASVPELGQYDLTCNLFGRVAQIDAIVAGKKPSFSLRGWSGQRRRSRGISTSALTPSRLHYARRCLGNEFLLVLLPCSRSHSGADGYRQQASCTGRIPGCFLIIRICENKEA